MSVLPQNLARRIAKLNKEAVDERTKKLHTQAEKLFGLSQSKHKDTMLWNFLHESNADGGSIPTPNSDTWREHFKVVNPYNLDGDGKFMLSLFTKGDVTDPHNVGSPGRGSPKFDIG